MGNAVQWVHVLLNGASYASVSEIAVFRWSSYFRLRVSGCVSLYCSIILKLAHVGILARWCALVGSRHLSKPDQRSVLCMKKISRVCWFSSSSLHYRFGYCQSVLEASGSMQLLNWLTANDRVGSFLGPGY